MNNDIQILTLNREFVPHVDLIGPFSFFQNGEYTVQRDLQIKSTPFCFQWFAQVLYSHV